MFVDFKNLILFIWPLILETERAPKMAQLNANLFDSSEVEAEAEAEAEDGIVELEHVPLSQRRKLLRASTKRHKGFGGIIQNGSETKVSMSVLSFI